jgi:hypothetical protein
MSLRPVYNLDKTLVPIELEAGWTPYTMIFTLLKRETILAFPGFEQRIVANVA